MVIILIVGFAIAIYIGLLNQPQPPTDATKALLAGEDLIRIHLHAPATAQFSPGDASATYSTRRLDGDWNVGGYVDDENGYAAVSRRKWQEIVQQQGSTWASRYWRVDDASSGAYPVDAPSVGN